MNHAEIVLYAREHLRDTQEPYHANLDWEVVALLSVVSPEGDPMSPYTMARNQLELPGGSRAEYAAEEYARAVLFGNEYLPLVAERATPGVVMRDGAGDDSALLRLARDVLAGRVLMTGRDFAEAIVQWHRAQVERFGTPTKPS